MRHTMDDMPVTLTFPLGEDDVTRGYDSGGSTINLANFGVESVLDALYGQVSLFGGAAHLELAASHTTAGMETRAFSVWAKPSSGLVALFSMGDAGVPGGLLQIYLGDSGQVSIAYAELPESVSPGALEPGEWSHLVLSYDGNNVQCYINGSLTLDESRSLDTTKTLLALGRATVGEDIPPFRGHMSDFRVYDHSLPQEDVSVLYQQGPRDSLKIETTALTVFAHEGIQADVVVNNGAVAVGDVTTRSLSLVEEKPSSGATALASFVYFHDGITSESVCVAESCNTVDENATQCTSAISLCNGDGMQPCLQYNGDSVSINSASRVATVAFDGLSFDSDEAAVVLGPFSEFRIKYDNHTDTLQIQHLEEGVYSTKVEYGR